MRTRELNGEQVRCYKCGKTGHQQSQCVGGGSTLSIRTYANSKKPDKKEVKRNEFQNASEDPTPTPDFNLMRVR